MLPYLFYDTAISFEFLNIDRPYRNAGDLLVSTCPSVVDALKLCGAESRIINGECSDYERFTALCYAMPYLFSHPVRTGTERILNALGIFEELSPYCVEDAWSVINSVIEEGSLTPSSLLSQMNVESVCCTVSPFDKIEKVQNDIDVYPVSCLLNVSELIISEKNFCDELSAFLSVITTVDSYSAVKLTLDRHYRYVRNSKRFELEEYYKSWKNGIGVKTDDLNAIITYVTVELAKKLKTSQKPLIIKADCPAEELDMLYSYLALNGIYPPATILVCNNAEDFKDFVIAHTTRTPIGMPSIIPVSKNTNALFKVFPAGFTLQYQEGVRDVVTLAAAMTEADSMSELYGEDIGEGINYSNVKNIFHI
jgi:hypothetical protein